MHSARKLQRVGRRIAGTDGRKHSLHRRGGGRLPKLGFVILRQRYNAKGQYRYQYRHKHYYFTQSITAYKLQSILNACLIASSVDAPGLSPNTFFSTF